MRKGKKRKRGRTHNISRSLSIIYMKECLAIPRKSSLIPTATLISACAHLQPTIPPLCGIALSYPTSSPPPHSLFLRHRGWWEEDAASSRRFYNHILGEWGQSPQFLEPWLAKKILLQHLYCPSMWAIFAIQVSVCGGSCGSVLS